MGKIVTIRIEDAVYESFTKRAKGENRSLGEFIEHAVIEYIKQKSFVDDDEMECISNDTELVGRIKRGTQDAKKGRGTMIAASHRKEAYR